MTRRAKKHEHVNHERWLVSYADFITLLFAFFVVMFAVSQVDAGKLGRFVDSVNIAFQIKGIFPDSEGTPLARGGGGGDSIVPMVVAPRPSFFTHSAASPRAKAIRESLETKIKEAGLADEVTLRHDPRGVIVSLPEEAFFRQGTASLLPQGEPRLLIIAEALYTEPGNVQIEAHTDDAATFSALFPSSWDLTAARAARLARFLVDDAGFEPERLSASGLAEFHPLVENVSDEDRELNRRVDLVLVTESLPAGG